MLVSDFVLDLGQLQGELDEVAPHLCRLRSGGLVDLVVRQCR